MVGNQEGRLELNLLESQKIPLDFEFCVLIFWWFHRYFGCMLRGINIRLLSSIFETGEFLT